MTKRNCLTFTNLSYQTDEWFQNLGQERRRALLAEARKVREDLSQRRKRVSNDMTQQFESRKRKSN